MEQQKHSIDYSKVSVSSFTNLSSTEFKIKTKNDDFIIIPSADKNNQVNVEYDSKNLGVVDGITFKSAPNVNNASIKVPSYINKETFVICSEHTAKVMVHQGYENVYIPGDLIFVNGRPDHVNNIIKYKIVNSNQHVDTDTNILPSVYDAVNCTGRDKIIDNGASNHIIIGTPENNITFEFNILIPSFCVK